MRRLDRRTVTVAAVLWATATLAQGPPPSVSPGSLRRAADTDRRCPSFDWGVIEGAEGYELVVYALGEDDPAADGARLVLQERLPAGVSGWTPEAARCLAPGGRFAWLVRAIGEAGPGPWSEPRLFRVVAPSATDVEQALAVLRAWVDAGGGEARAPNEELEAPLLVGRERAGQAGGAAVPGAGSEAAGDAAVPAGVPIPDGVAIRGALADTAGVTFGLHGVSASSDTGAAGVVGQSTAASGATAGVRGVVESAAGIAGVFDNTAGGPVLSGRHDGLEIFAVDGAGAVTAGSFAGDGSALTEVDAATLGGQAGAFYRDWQNLTSVPPGFADGVDDDSGGDVTAVTAGAGLAGGGAAGDLTLAIEFTQTQARVIGSCPPGTAIVAILSNGDVDCGYVEFGVVITTLDAVGAANSSIAIGVDGLPVISYEDSNALKVAKCNDPACAGGDETISTVDDPANLVGFDTSIAIGADGSPVISYYDVTAGALKVAKCNDPACAGGDETINTVDDPVNDVGRYTSIAIGVDGLPVISYTDVTADALKVTKCNDPACRRDNVTITTVDDPASGVGLRSSTTMGADGLPVISYFDRGLKVATCNDPACAGGDETIATVDQPLPSLVGDYPSIAVGDDGLPVISYYDATDGALKVAKCNDAACTGGDETITTVDDPANQVGRSTSIVIGADGLPVISYYDDTAGALRVAKCNDPACAGGDETITAVDDPANNVGLQNSIAIGADGLPVISYNDSSAATIKVVKCANGSCT